jgi:hypothetical protein
MWSFPPPSSEARGKTYKNNEERQQSVH